MAQLGYVSHKPSLHSTVTATSSGSQKRKRADINTNVSAEHRSVMASSPKKRRLRQSPEEHASLQTTEAGGSSAKEDTKYDKKKLMEKLKTAGTKEKYKRVPVGLRDLIDRLCAKHDVKHAAWAQSADWREVEILGRGATGILEELRETAKSEFPEYYFDAVESGPSHTTNLCSSSSQALHVVVERGETSEHGVSELILKGRPKTSEAANIYIGCTAHGVLTEKQWNELDTSNDIHHIETIRQEVVESSTKYTLKAQLDNNNDKKNFPLSGPPLICYRHFYTDGEACPAERCDGDAPLNCPHMYENDIALLQLDGHTVDQLREGLGAKFQHYHDIMDFTREDIDDFIDLRIPVHIKDAKCFLVPELRATAKDKEYEEGWHIRFVEDKAEKIDGGDSGSVLYVEDEDKRRAIAMLVSKLPKVQNKSKLGYTAILLRRALDDIEADYKIEALDLLKPAAAPDQC